VRLINNLQTPSFAEEKILEAQGYQHIAGIDEAGRGALAGPVVAAAVILPCRIDAPWLIQVKDSKQLSPVVREHLFHNIHEIAVSVGIGMATNEVIDSQGIMLLPDVPLPQKGITNGDSLCFSIACASIMAKVSRDQLMIELDRIYPGYGLAQHKGYGTKKHFTCLYQLGPSPIHRQSFKPVKDIIEK